MSNKDTVFYTGKTAIKLDFSAEKISSDGALLLDKLECKHKLTHIIHRLMNNVG